MRTVFESARATTDGSGDATLRINGPHRIGTRWELSSVVVSCERDGTTYPVASIYRSAVVPAQLMGESRSADRVTFDAKGDVLLPGDVLVVVVSGASPSTAVQVNLYGDEFP